MSRRRYRPIFPGAVLVFVGLIFLVNNLGLADAGELFSDYWPVFLILLGLSILLRGSKTVQSPPPDSASKNAPDSSPPIS